MEDRNEKGDGFSDEERRELAFEILRDVVSGKVGGSTPTRLSAISYTDAGEPVPMYDGTSPDGYGSFICEYMPLATVETLITESSRIYDEIQERERLNFGRAYRTEDVRRMAAVATRFLLNDLQRAISEALTEAFLDARLIAEAVLVMGVAEELEPQATAFYGKPAKVTADARGEIEEAARRVADSKRFHLRDLLGRLPHIIAETRRGRRPLVTLEKIRSTRDKLISEGLPAGVPEVADELGRDESTVYRCLKDSGKTLDDL